MDECNEHELNEEDNLKIPKDFFSKYNGKTVEETVLNIMEYSNQKPEKVIKNINKLIDDEKIRIIDPTPPSNFNTYFISLYNIRFWVLLIFLTSSVFSIYILPFTYPLFFLRYFYGGIILLYLPGLSLIEALYPKEKEMNGIEKFGLSVGFSFALVPLIGFIINLTPFKIGLYTILPSLIFFILTLNIYSVYRKYVYCQMTSR